MKPAPYKVAIAEPAVADLRRRLDATRYPPDLDNERGTYGVRRDWLEPLIDYWRGDFDWRAQEAAINAYPQFMVEIDGVPIHFVHVRGEGAACKPLILSHGWPWTFWDYRGCIDRLTRPSAHGGRAEDAYDVVVPSLPGYGFSPLTRSGIDVARIAQLWVRLMRDVLGYPRFGAVGGDWGSFITGQLGHAHAEHMIGVYMTMVAVPGMDVVESSRSSPFAPDEQWMPARVAETQKTGLAHFIPQSYEPQTLAYMLTDSPAGMAAWIWGRRLKWSDCGGDILSVYSADFLCTLASIYWFNCSMATSLRLYFETFGGGWPPRAHDRTPVIEAPTGYGVFPKDLAFLPRKLVEETTNLKRWSVMPRGGHFAPAEQPDLVVDEVRAFFADLD